jgi:hypothetical protein
MFKFFNNSLKFIKKKEKFKDVNSWVKIDNNLEKTLIKTVKITGVYETLNDIKFSIINKKKGAYLRFGDGDIMLKNGVNEMMQETSNDLQKEMDETFSLTLQGKLHKSISIHSQLFGFDEHMNLGMHLLPDDLAIKLLSSTYQYFVGRKIFSPVALHYSAVYDYKECVIFLKLLKLQNPIFVGNEKISLGLSKKLFGNEIIKTPSRNSYLEIDRIEKELCQLLDKYDNNFKVVVVAMGCAGRVLQKRILLKGYNVYLFDFGSLLDALDNQETRTWIRMVDNKVFDKILNLM